MSRSKALYTPSMSKALSSADSEIRKAQGRLKVGLYLSDVLQKGAFDVGEKMRAGKQYDQIADIVGKNPDLSMPSKYEFMSGNRNVRYKDMFDIDSSTIRNLDLLYNKEEDILKLGEFLGIDLKTALDSAGEL